MKKYAPEMIARAFEYFASSRSLYRRLRDDFELPSISLLTKLTSKVGNLEDNEFLHSYFEHCTDLRQRNVIIIIDEIYVKPQLSYQGGGGGGGCFWESRECTRSSCYNSCQLYDNLCSDTGYSDIDSLSF